MNARITLPILLALIAVHVFLAASFATKTPWRTGGIVSIGGGVVKDIGAPDERQHANYIARLAKGEGLPVFNAEDPNLYESYQSHQPPLYYGIAAAWSKLTGSSAIESRDTGLRLRSLNVILGAITVAGVFFAAWWATREDAAALGAAAFAALIPMHLALSGAVSNDPLLIALCTWTLAILALSVREGWTAARALTVGLLVGLALLTKTTALALLPALLVAVIVRRPNGKAVLAAAVPILILSLPWFARNQSLYGDPFAIGAFNKAFVGSAQKEMMVGQVIPSAQPFADPEIAYWKDWVGFWTARSFVGVFGYMDIWLTQSGRLSAKFDENRIYWVVLGVIAVGLLVGLRGFGDSKSRGVLAIYAIFGLVILALFVQFNRQYFQAQGRYIYPALAVWATGIGLGLSAWKKRPMVGVALLVLLLGGIDALALSRLDNEFALRIEAGRQSP
ncbi:DUF2142 domain-containing protein [bacterium]|nr:MAG: DUF2142 domain-containing protein [bacterium]